VTSTVQLAREIPDASSGGRNGVFAVRRRAHGGTPSNREKKLFICREECLQTSLMSKPDEEHSRTRRSVGKSPTCRIVIPRGLMKKDPTVKKEMPEERNAFSEIVRKKRFRVVPTTTSPADVRGARCTR